MVNNTAYKDAIQMLSRKGYSEKQLREKLHRKKHPNEMIDGAISDLIKRGYLNDTALCSTVFQQYQRTEKYGIMGIVHKLRQQGFPEEAIQQTLRETEVNDEWQMVVKFIEKQQRYRQIDPGALYRRLLSRGFSASVARKAAEQMQEKIRNHY